MNTKWEKFDPSWLIEIAKEQIAEEKEIIKNLEQCNSCLKESKAYYYFILCNNPNELNSKWLFKKNIMLNSEKHGEIVLDILKDNKIGGIEFINKI